MSRWLLDPDDRLVRHRVAKYWAELLTHDDVAKAIEEVIQEEEKELSQEDKEIQAAGKKFKDAHVSTPPSKPLPFVSTEISHRPS